MTLIAAILALLVLTLIGGNVRLRVRNADLRRRVKMLEREMCRVEAEQWVECAERN